MLKITSQIKPHGFFKLSHDEDCFEINHLAKYCIFCMKE